MLPDGPYLFYNIFSDIECSVFEVLPSIFQDVALDKITVKILKIGTPEIITMVVLQLEQLDFTVQYCIQKMQTE